MNVRKMAAVAVAALLLAAGAAQATVTIDTVHVGDPGNAADTRYATPGHGSVSYEYNIGKYEVTAGQYCEFLNAVAKTDTYSLYNTGMSNTSDGSGITRAGGGTVVNPYTYTVASSHVNRPVNYVSYWDSCRFSNWLNNGQPTGAQGAGTTERGTYTLDGYNGTDGRTIQRNPGSKWAVTSEDEWYKASYHKNDGVTGNYFDYPTSSNTVPGRDMADVSGNNANYWTGSGPYPIDSPYYTTVGGEFQDSESPYGTFDQGGNVWEWNEAIVYQEPTYSSRGLRGGSFLYDGNLRAAYRHDYYPTSEFGYIGFRVSEVPEPSAMALLAFGGIGMLVRRRELGR